MIIVVNYDAGNLYSVSRALKFLGIPHSVTSDRKKIEQADGLILPGVGSASRAMSSLDRKGLLSVLKSYERPFLGICLGLQLLFERSQEHRTQCLGLVEGEVCKFDKKVLKVPHMGWNQLHFQASKPDPILSGVDEGSFFYFVHSYYAPLSENITTGYTDYESTRFSSLIRHDNFWGVQFHPELSGETGLLVLKNFITQCL